uniref:Ionotropic receptor n=1 Tax=Anopheles stephensi TaxID=30069 RepID=A0A182Y820_ANOST
MIIRTVSFLLVLLEFSQCSPILDIVTNIAQLEHTNRPEGLEVCFVQFREYSTQKNTLDDTILQLVQRLASRYPITLARQRRSVFMYAKKEASLVLMDASGYGKEFPASLGSNRLTTHECYAKSAKFIVIVDIDSDRTQLAAFFHQIGVLNYIALPVNYSVATGAFNVGLLYTDNPFTKELHLFDVRHHNASNASRYYPHKLANLRGYEFLGFGMFEFPYIFELSDKRTGGLVMEYLHTLIVRKLNGTVRMVNNQRTPLDGRSEFDMTFAYTSFREHYMHDVTLKEHGGYCVLCPFRTERDFLRHLLKPFSFGIWLVLGALIVVCRLLGRLLPRLFQRNLLEEIFFSSTTPHRQPFPTRVVSFAVTVLIFFLSEAYNAKIVSLMSISKYFDRPETVRELIESEFRIAIPGVRAPLIAEAFPGKLIPRWRAEAIYRERGELMYTEYCTVTYCYLANMQAALGRNQHGFQQYVLKDMVVERFLTLQLATHSPFYELFADFLERYFQSGIWMHRLEFMNRKLVREMEPVRNRFGEVVFHFDDLACVWVLIIVGWLLGTVALGAELVWFYLERRLRVGWHRLKHRVRLGRLVWMK